VGIVRLVRRHWLYLALGCWAAVWFAVLAPRGGIDWKFFTTGTSLLFGGHPAVIGGITGGSDAAGPAGLPGPPPPGGLYIYGNYPALQMGPFSYLVTGALRQLAPDNGLAAAEVLLQAAGLLAVYLIERIALIARPSLAGTRAFRLTLLAGGAAFLVAWSELAAAFAHLDDGLALLLAVLAVRAAVPPAPVTPSPGPAQASPRPATAFPGPAGASRSLGWPPVLAGLCVGLAVDAKPWALVFLPVLLMFGTGRRGLLAFTAAALTIAVAWLPFYIADPGTLHAAKYLIRNEPMSALRALGVGDNYTPSWDRIAQAALGCGLGALAVWRRRWPAILLLAGGARIVLDPAAHSYYTPDVMVGALLWDLLGTRRPYPLWTITSFAALNLAPHVISSPAAQGTIRLALVAAFTVATLAFPASPPRNTVPPRSTMEYPGLLECSVHDSPPDTPESPGYSS
jgi:hypothetical protein